MTLLVVRSALKNTYFQALGLARVDKIARAIHARTNQVLVLNLHRVSPDPSPYWPPLTPEAFEKLVAYLDATCDVLTFEELERRRPRDRPRVVLSFDDGCRDFIAYAMPILDRYRMRVNQNVIVQSVETGRPPWIIAVMDALNVASRARVQALRVPGFLHTLEGDADRDKVRYGTLLARYLKAKPADERTLVCSDIDALLRETRPDSWTPMMSRKETGEVAEVHELGSHSYRHESMAHMTEREFADDCDRCEGLFASLGRSVKIFAFPNGSYRQDQIAAIQKRGVAHVLLVDERTSAVVRGVHPRITMYGDTRAELRLRAMGWRPVRKR